MAVILVLESAAFAQPRVDKNVVFGMYSGAALLMDVYHPVQSNGLGLVVIQGSGWYMPQRYDAPVLKDDPMVTAYGRRFAEAGYTTFVINHRAAPRFRYPAPIEDAQRAVRFIRHNAGAYAIDARRLGAWGASSGGHLAALLGTLDGAGDPSDSDPVNRQSAKVQAVVTLFPATDLPSLTSPRGATAAVALMGFRHPPDPSTAPPGSVRPDEPEIKAYRDASPTTHVTRDDAPFLLMHGDADVIAPIQQSELLEQKLTSAGVPVRLIRVPGGQHGPYFLLNGKDEPRRPDDFGEALKWFDQYLKRPAQAGRAEAAVAGGEAARCRALVDFAAPDLPDASTRIQSARLVDVAAGGLPAPSFGPPVSSSAPIQTTIKQYCQVTGYVAPQNKFELRLPLPADWNHRFFFTPCAGLCGGVNGDPQRRP
jgi:acetyl esterase/lipase